jgi:hypothetical protein
MNRCFLAVVVVFGACGQAWASSYDPGAALQAGPTFFGSPTTYDSRYCQVGDTRRCVSTEAWDMDDEYDDLGLYVGEVQDGIKSNYNWQVAQGPGTIILDGTTYYYVPPDHGGGSVRISRTHDDVGLYADDQPETFTSETLVLGPARVEVRALVDSSWEPQGWPDESSLTVKARSLDADPVEGRGDVNGAHFFAPPGLAAPAQGWTTTLVSITISGNFSQLPGICSNYDKPVPLLPEGTNPDFSWLTNNVDQTKEDGVLEAQLQSHDWGGNATFSATAAWDTPEGSFPLSVHVSHPQEIQVPPDEDGDTLTDDYEADWNSLDSTMADTDSDGVRDDADDDDPDPAEAPGSTLGPNPPGDGYNAFDEYRGFFVLDGTARVFERGSSDIKHLMVRDYDNIGLGYTGNSGVNVHKIESGMWASHNEGGTLWSPNGGDGTAHGGVVNFNGLGPPMKGVLLRRNYTPRPGWTGCCFTTTVSPEPPSGVIKVEVYDSPNPSNTIAHEIGHGMAMTHPSQIEGCIMDEDVSNASQYSARSIKELRLK